MSKEIYEAIGLLNSMVACGDEHTEKSKQVVETTREEIARLQAKASKVETLENVVQSIVDCDNEDYCEVCKIRAKKALEKTK